MQTGSIDGVTVKALTRHGDQRGHFLEIVRSSEGLFSAGFGQLSWATRSAGTVTAWHIHPRQWDWWFVPHGTLRVVLHDLRAGSSTFRRTQEVMLGADGTDRLVAIPPGVAHGYKVLTDAEILYVTSHEYNDAHPAPPEGEEGRIPADDPDIGYDWTKA